MIHPRVVKLRHLRTTQLRTIEHLAWLLGVRRPDLADPARGDR